MQAKFWYLVILVGFVAFSFVPYVQKCTYEGDVGYCESYYIHQATWWQQAVAVHSGTESGRPEVVWDSWGWFYIWQEGIVDFYQAGRELWSS